MKTDLARALSRKLRLASILLLLGFVIVPAQGTQAASFAVALNGTSAGRQYDGLGGLSGGGGTSRLLYDYPAAQQSAILDYLFKPNYGASLQILKVEIGGDTDTTEGAEASSQRTSTDQNFQRGYEWWLMQQAKARNPNIKLYALEWGAPSWFSGGFWSTDNINYIINWINHARTDYGLTINYIGGWNERGYNKTWYENLRTALNNAGLSAVQIVADDAASGWAVADDMTSDATFKAAVGIVGVHYTCGYLSNGSSCTDTANAKNLGKQLWSSENGSEDYNAGAAAIARAVNRDYIDGQMTAFINWNLVAAYYSTYPFANDGLISAQQPWSGNYGIGKSVWAMAHTAQFAQPGWHYLDTSSGYLGGNRANGSYVTLKATNNTDYSTIIETMDATTANTVNFTVGGGLSTGTVHVWSTNLNSSNSADYFVHSSDITPSGGAYSLTVQPGYIYSITTTTGQTKGTATSPASAAMSLPYTDNFESYTVGAMPNIPRYFATTMGAYEAENCLGGRSGKCMQQEITAEPITWCCSSALPQSAMGDPSWTNYTVSSDVLLPQAGAVEIVGRMTAQYENNTGSLIGYHLQLSNTGAWKLYYLGGGTWATPNSTTLASGTVSYGTNIWTTLKLTFNGSNIQATIGSTVVANVTNTSSGNGQVAVQTQGWYKSQFDNFSITTGGGPGPTPTPSSTPITRTNIALNKTASADSSQSGHAPSAGNDGSTTTRWCAADGNLNHWWEVDLGSAQTLTGSEVMWEFSGRVYKYRVDVSTDNATWTTVVDKTANTSTAQTQTDNFTATARYVRITATGLPTSPTTWASFFEFRVFNN